ncbi:MAG TPA: AmmeMemoRadiSam system protein A [Tepidisphaeraceae bacterium]|jgi:AmmeMemoRadiSam system protein A|nr:AmmeMemoRadiSam system protein A [Tepidisphaeraceae bacterium]
MEIPPQTGQAILDLATDVVTRRLGGDPRPLPPLDDPLFSGRTGCFVSLHRRDPRALRGCIGTFDPGKSLRESLVSAAESVLGDPRFLNQPVTRHELQNLDIEVTILGPLEKAKSPLDFDPGRHGIHLTLRGRTGLFLPQVARETGWTREQLLARLCTEKLGLPENAWTDPSAELRTFTADILGPRPMIL